MQRSETVENLNTAFAKWLTERPDINKDKAVDVYNKQGKFLYTFNYATLGNIIKLYAPTLGKHGLSVTQEVTDKGVYTYLEHSSGEWKTYGPLSIKMKDEDGNELKEQSIGSSITYKKRYQLNAVLFIDAEDDDDANTADGQHAKPKGKSAPKKQSSAPKQKSEPKKQQQEAPKANSDDSKIEEWIDSIETQEGSEKLVNWYQAGLNGDNGKEFEKKWKQKVMQKMQEL